MLRALSRAMSSMTLGRTLAGARRAKSSLGTSARAEPLRKLADNALITQLLDWGDELGVEFGAEQFQRPEALHSLISDLAQRASPAALPPGPLQRLHLLIEFTRRLQPRAGRSTTVRSLDDVALWARRRLVHLEHEELWVLCLGARNQLQSAERVAQGGLHGCGVTPKDVLRPAVRNAATALVVVHNHPSGDPTPSEEDVAMTEQLSSAALVLGLPLLDHVVVAREGACSAVEAMRHGD